MTCLVEVGVVDAHPKLPVRLGDDDGIGQPLGVVDLLDEVSVQQFVYLFTDEVLLLHGLLLRFLAHRLGVWVDLQVVLDHFSRDPRHLRRFPGKHVDICLEESDECAFLFLPQATRDASSLGGLRSDLDGLHGDVVRIRRLNHRCPCGRFGS